jgi:hypothetical protein
MPRVRAHADPRAAAHGGSREYNRLVDRARAWPILVCGALSVGLHVTGFEIAPRGAAPAATVETATLAAISGDTLDIEQTQMGETETGGPTVDLREPSPGTTTAHDPSGGQARPPPSHDVARGSARSSADVVERFGAVGARFATDLTMTFTRSLPQAFSADPAWLGAPFGPAGSVDVLLALDEAGHLATRSMSGAPPPALRSSVERTFALLATRTFTARQAVTRLHLTAHIVRDELHDGLHGDVFALSGGSLVGNVGSAFFALPGPTGPGRRVDIEIRLAR